jgi:hypothetical protein
LSESNDERRDRYRKNCQPRPIDLCSIGSRVVFYAMTIVDESLEGLGCVVDNSEELPNSGATLDWCGLKRYEVRWIAKEKDGKARVGLKIA